MQDVVGWIVPLFAGARPADGTLDPPCSSLPHHPCLARQPLPKATMDPAICLGADPARGREARERESVCFSAEFCFGSTLARRPSSVCLVFVSLPYIHHHRTTRQPPQPSSQQTHRWPATRQLKCLLVALSLQWTSGQSGVHVLSASNVIQAPLKCGGQALHGPSPSFSFAARTGGLSTDPINYHRDPKQNPHGQIVPPTAKVVTAPG